jgi:predicted thioesterase
VGESIYSSALVESVSGDRIVFAVELGSAEVQVGKGKITRVRVDQRTWAN